MPIRILLVDDESAIRFGIHDFLEAHGYQVDGAETCEGAEHAFRALPPDLVILDYKLPDGNALDLLPRLKAIDPEIPIAILTAHGSIDLAVRAIREGAEQFITKPVELSILLVIVERLLEQRRKRQRQLADEARRSREALDPFLGTSDAIRRLAAQVLRLVAAEIPILILGETGTGKGVLAHWLHRNGPRADEAFVDLNCAGLSREFLETELCGHEKGAFTGAVAAKIGLLEIAHRGTVFLDEIGDMDLHVQPRLLKVLEEKRFRRMGSVSDRHVDIHLLSASHHDLGRLAAEQKFRSDLYFRISAIPLSVPSLRTRIEDVPVLARHLLKRIAADLGRAEARLSPAAEAVLQAYAWPGNIRELRNVLERAVLLSDRSVLDAGDLRIESLPAAGVASDEVNLPLAEIERRHIERVLAAEGGHVPRAAARLGIPRSSLYEKIKKLGLVVPEE
jgi:DNA-binding NtrC family response regulator